MPPTVEFSGFPAPFPQDLPVISFDDLLKNRPLTTVQYRLTESAVRHHRDLTSSLQDSLHPIPEESEVEVPPCLTAVVGLLKLAIGGPWPDDTIHVRQEIYPRSRLVVDQLVKVEVIVDRIEIRADRQIVTFLSTTSHLDGRTAVISRSTFFWGGGVKAVPPETAHSPASPLDEVAPPACKTPLLSTAFITQEMLTDYGAVAGAMAGIHTDPVYASRTEFGGVVAQGMLLTALVAEYVERRVSAWSALGDLDLRFLSPVPPGQAFEICDYEKEGANGRAISAKIRGVAVVSGSWSSGGV